jgi:hypothetical protein
MNETFGAAILLVAVAALDNAKVVPSPAMSDSMSSLLH